MWSVYLPARRAFIVFISVNGRDYTLVNSLQCLFGCHNQHQWLTGAIVNLWKIMKCSTKSCSPDKDRMYWTVSTTFVSIKLIAFCGCMNIYLYTHILYLYKYLFTPSVTAGGGQNVYCSGSFLRL